MKTMMSEEIENVDVSAGNAGTNDSNNDCACNNEEKSNADTTDAIATADKEELLLQRTCIAFVVPNTAMVDGDDHDDGGDDDDENEDETSLSGIKPDECDVMMPMCSVNSEIYIENILRKTDEALCVCSVTDNFENLVGVQVCGVDDDNDVQDVDDDNDIIDRSFEDDDDGRMAGKPAWEETLISAALLDSFTAHKKFNRRNSGTISTSPNPGGEDVDESVLVGAVTAFIDMVRNPFPADVPPINAKAAAESVSTCTATKTALKEDITNVTDGSEDNDDTSAANHNNKKDVWDVIDTSTNIDVGCVSTALTSAGKEVTLEEMKQDFEECGDVGGDNEDVFKENTCIAPEEVNAIKNNDLLIHMATADHVVGTCKKMGSSTCTKKRKATKKDKARSLMKRLRLLPNKTTI